MPRRLHWAAIFIMLFASTAQGQEPIIIEGEVPPGSETHFFVPFQVPDGIVEIEIRHDNLTPGNILDWGLDDPNGFRGWGGGNSEPAIVGVEAATPSYVPGPIPAGTWEVVVGKARIDELPALYRIEIFLRTEATLEDQPRTPYQDPGVLDDEARWYAGDFHVHSRQSGDADPTIEEALDYAKGVGLDFVMLSEHNTNSGPWRGVDYVLGARQRDRRDRVGRPQDRGSGHDGRRCDPRLPRPRRGLLSNSSDGTKLEPLPGLHVGVRRRPYDAWRIGGLDRPRLEGFREVLGRPLQRGVPRGGHWRKRRSPCRRARTSKHETDWNTDDDGFC
jgi:hypothetical protein